MPQHALDGNLGHRTQRAVGALVAWHDRRPRASLSTARGWVWATLIAATFFWMSNPLVYIPSFYLSLGEALTWTKVLVIVTLPWLRVPRVPWPWLVFLGLCVLSQLWTINDFHTDVSDTVYIQMTVLAAVVAANCRAEVVCWGLGMGGVAVVALSVRAYLEGMPGASNAAVGGATFTGVGTNENILAYTLVVSLAATLATGRPSRALSQVAWLFVLGVNLLGIFLAGSGTGFTTMMITLAVALSVLFWPALQRASRRLVLLSATGLVFVLVAGLLVVTVGLGKELATLSGRVPFWRAAVATTLERAPWTGSGWGAVWEHPWDPTPANDVATEIYVRAGFPLPHGHILLIDVLPELGFLGVAAVLLMLAYAVREVRRCGLRAASPDPVAGRLLLLVLVVIISSGVTEPMLTVPLGWWTLALVVAVPRQRAAAVEKYGSERPLTGARRRAAGPAWLVGRKAGSDG
jgi:O-antigen ligase